MTSSFDSPVDLSVPASSRRDWLTRSAAGRLAATAATFLGLAIVLIGLKGAHPTLQTTLHGLVTGSYVALAAVGLTFVYGILRLINFAQGDFLTFGAYSAFLFNVTIGLGIVPSAVLALLLTALLAV